MPIDFSNDSRTAHLYPVELVEETPYGTRFRYDGQEFLVAGREFIAYDEPDKRLTVVWSSPLQYFEMLTEAGSMRYNTPRAIRRVCEEVCELLLRKNRQYGDSAMDPVRVFSTANPVEQIRVRIDDKLSRVTRGERAADEDTILDLLGYFVLLLIAERRAAMDPPKET